MTFSALQMPPRDRLLSHTILQDLRALRLIGCKSCMCAHLSFDPLIDIEEKNQGMSAPFQILPYVGTRVESYRRGRIHDQMPRESYRDAWTSYPTGRLDWNFLLPIASMRDG